MPSGLSSNAILAKARAMYGKGLSEEDYRHLLECRTVSEIAACLRSDTGYSEDLAPLGDSVHRGQLEPLLRKKLYRDLFKLTRYAGEEALEFADFSISKLEIEQIVHCLTLLNIGHPEELIVTIPRSLSKSAHLDLSKLITMRTYDDLLEAAAGSAYAATLRAFRPAEGERIDIAAVESELNNRNYGRILETIDKSKNKRDRKELRDLITAMLDFRNISRIFRLKKYYHYDSERIRPLLIPYGRLSRRTLEELCAADSAEQVLEGAKGTCLGRTIDRLDETDQEKMSIAMMGTFCRHHLRLSPNPTIVMISYFYLKEIEVSNIVNIIEGTRYGLSPEEKAKLLVR